MMMMLVRNFLQLKNLKLHHPYPCSRLFSSSGGTQGTGSDKGGEGEPAAIFIPGNKKKGATSTSSSKKKKSKKSFQKKRKFKNQDENGLPLLSPKDCDERVQFASRLLTMLENDPSLLDKIIFTDEGNFNLPKISSSRNLPYNTNKRYGESTILPQIVWCGMTTKYVIGPYFFNAHLTDRTYLRMLHNYLIPQLLMLEEGPAALDSWWWFQQDGNPPHRSRKVLKYLGDTFGPRLISRGCQIPWPSRSQDLTPLDYFLWDHLKDKLDSCYLPEELRTPGLFRSSLVQVIEDMEGEIIKRAVAQFPKRLEKCLDANGHRFEFRRGNIFDDE